MESEVRMHVSPLTQIFRSQIVEYSGHNMKQCILAIATCGTSHQMSHFTSLCTVSMHFLAHTPVNGYYMHLVEYRQKTHLKLQ